MRLPRAVRLIFIENVIVLLCLHFSSALLLHFLLFLLSTVNISTLEFEYANQCAVLTNAWRCWNYWMIFAAPVIISSDFLLSSPPASLHPFQWNSLWEMSFLRAANQLPDRRLASCVNSRGNWVRRCSLIELIRGREWKQMEGMSGGRRVEGGGKCAQHCGSALVVSEYLHDENTISTLMVSQ